MLIDWGSFQHLLDFTQHLVRTSLGLTWEALSMAYQTTPSKGVPVKAWPCPHCGLQDLPSSLATPAVPLSSLSGSPPQWAASVSLTSFSSLMSSIHTCILGKPPGHDMLEEPFLSKLSYFSLWRWENKVLTGNGLAHSCKLLESQDSN